MIIIWLLSYGNGKFSEAITYLTWSAKQTLNICESVTVKNRQEHAQRLLSAKYEKMFTTDCRLRSLLARFNRCSKEYSASLFQGVPGVRISGYPTVRFDVSNLHTLVRSEFEGKWGEEGVGVEPDIFFPCRDALLNKFAISTKEPDYAPKYDSTRVLIGSEFQHRFGRSRSNKRSRDESPRVPFGKGEF